MQAWLAEVLMKGLCWVLEVKWGKRIHTSIRIKKQLHLPWCNHVDEVIKVSSLTRVMKVSKLWQKSLSHISRGRIVIWIEKDRKSKNKKLRKMIERNSPLYALHLEKKWSIKDEDDRWGSTTVIIKIPLSIEIAKFLNILQFNRKIAMRLRNTKTVLKATNEIDFNRINPK
jgi:hypothetical protein